MTVPSELAGESVLLWDTDLGGEDLLQSRQEQLPTFPAVQ